MNNTNNSKKQISKPQQKTKAPTQSVESSKKVNDPKQIEKYSKKSTTTAPPPAAPPPPAPASLKKIQSQTPVSKQPDSSSEPVSTDQTQPATEPQKKKKFGGYTEDQLNPRSLIFKKMMTENAARVSEKNKWETIFNKSDNERMTSTVIPAEGGTTQLLWSWSIKDTDDKPDTENGSNEENSSKNNKKTEFTLPISISEPLAIFSIGEDASKNIFERGMGTTFEGTGDAKNAKYNWVLGVGMPQSLMEFENARVEKEQKEYDEAINRNKAQEMQKEELLEKGESVAHLKPIPVPTRTPHLIFRQRSFIKAYVAREEERNVTQRDDPLFAKEIKDKYRKEGEVAWLMSKGKDFKTKSMTPELKKERDAYVQIFFEHKWDEGRTKPYKATKIKGAEGEEEEGFEAIIVQHAAWSSPKYREFGAGAISSARSSNGSNEEHKKFFSSGKWPKGYEKEKMIYDKLVEEGFKLMRPPVSDANGNLVPQNIDLSKLLYKRGDVVRISQFEVPFCANGHYGNHSRLNRLQIYVAADKNSSGTCFEPIEEPWIHDYEKSRQENVKKQNEKEKEKEKEKDKDNENEKEKEKHSSDARSDDKSESEKADNPKSTKTSNGKSLSSSMFNVDTGSAMDTNNKNTKQQTPQQQQNLKVGQSTFKKVNNNTFDNSKMSPNNLQGHAAVDSLITAQKKTNTLKRPHGEIEIEKPVNPKIQKVENVKPKFHKIVFDDDEDMNKEGREEKNQNQNPSIDVDEDIEMTAMPVPVSSPVEEDGEQNGENDIQPAQEQDPNFFDSPKQAEENGMRQQTFQTNNEEEENDSEKVLNEDSKEESLEILENQKHSNGEEIETDEMDDTPPTAIVEQSQVQDKNVESSMISQEI